MGNCLSLAMESILVISGTYVQPELRRTILIPRRYRWTAQEEKPAKYWTGEKAKFWASKRLLERVDVIKWNEIRLAADAYYYKDYSGSQDVIDKSFFYVPYGDLELTIDRETGEIYRIPLYCLSLPENLAQVPSTSGISGTSVQLQPHYVPDSVSLGTPDTGSSSTLALVHDSGEEITVNDDGQELKVVGDSSSFDTIPLDDDDEEMLEQNPP